MKTKDFWGTDAISLYVKNHMDTKCVTSAGLLLIDCFHYFSTKFHCVLMCIDSFVFQ